MSDLFLKSTDLDKYNSRGDFLHLDIDYTSNAIRLDFDSTTAITTDDGSLIIGLNVTHATGITAGSKSITLPLALCFTIHSDKNEYEMFDMDEYKKSKDAKAAKKKIKQQPLEALLLKAIAAQNLDFSVPKAGFVSVSTSPNDDSFIDGTFPLEKYRFCQVVDAVFDETTKNPLTGKNLAATGAAQGGGGAYKSNAQTELAKLYDRQNVIKTISNAWLNNLHDTKMTTDDRDTAVFMKIALNDPNLRDYLSLIMGVSLPVIQCVDNGEF
jgi:hypothetical protein